MHQRLRKICIDAWVVLNKMQKSLLLSPAAFAMVRVQGNPCFSFDLKYKHSLCYFPLIPLKYTQELLSVQEELSSSVSSLGDPPLHLCYPTSTILFSLPVHGFGNQSPLWCCDSTHAV